MAEIIQFRRPPTAREEAINRLAAKLVAYLSVRLYEKGVLDDIPVAQYVDDMKRGMLNDDFIYEVDVLDMIANDEQHLARIATKFNRILQEAGYPVDATY